MSQEKKPLAGAMRAAEVLAQYEADHSWPEAPRPKNSKRARIIERESGLRELIETAEAYLRADRMQRMGTFSITLLDAADAKFQAALKRVREP